MTKWIDEYYYSKKHCLKDLPFRVELYRMTSVLKVVLWDKNKKAYWRSFTRKNVFDMFWKKINTIPEEKFPDLIPLFAFKECT